MRNSVTVSRTDAPFHSAMNRRVSSVQRTDRHGFPVSCPASFFLVRDAAAAEKDLHPRGELPKGKGLAQVIIRAQLQAEDPVELFVA